MTRTTWTTRTRTSSCLIPRNLTDKKPIGSAVLLDPLRIKSLSKADTQKKLLLISTIGEVLCKKGRNFTFWDKKLSTQLAKDLNKIVPKSSRT